MLPAPDKARIETAIAAVERQTGGEIVLLLAPSSQFYGWVHLLWGFAGWVASSLALVLLYHSSGLRFTPSQIVFWQLVGVNLWSLLSFIPTLKRLSIPRKHREEVVAEKARACFFQNDQESKKNPKRRVYVFLSFFERAAEMRGDPQLMLQVNPDYWKARSEDLKAAMASGEWTVALSRIIAQVGELIEEYSPTPLTTETAPTNQLYN